MKIAFTGGGTGGHFYPIIAVAQAVNDLVEKEKLVDVKMYFLSDGPYDKRALFENNITFVKVEAGKMRRYFSLLNLIDYTKTGFGLVRAVLKLYRLFPDVVFGKGGYASFPTLFAARLLGIPVIIHESDSVPGRVNLWAGKFAKRVAVSYPDAAELFPKERTALIGVPIRKELRTPITNGAYEFLGLSRDVPVILIIGGSQGSQKINDTVIDVLPQLIEKYQIIHQTGAVNYRDAAGRAEVVIATSPYRERYKPFDFLNPAASAMAAGVAALVVSRAGSAIFEIAEWGLPSLIIPIPVEVSRDQRSNAFAFARSGACVVLEEENLSPHVLLAEINRLMTSKHLTDEMRAKAKSFARPDAAEKIAREIINLALEHEA